MSPRCFIMEMNGHVRKVCVCTVTVPMTPAHQEHQVRVEERGGEGRRAELHDTRSGGHRFRLGEH